MARAACRTCGETARAGVLGGFPLVRAAAVGAILMAAACARVQEPPGGPPDFTPPSLLETQPDSGAVLPGFDGSVLFQFDEVISERSGGSLDQLIAVSPRMERVNVRWRRTAIDVRPHGGWLPGTVYTVTLLPGVADLRNNRSPERHTVVFSTGDEIPDTEIRGTIVDWGQGRSTPRGLIEAVAMPDSVVYVARADSIGDFTLPHLPRGTYLVYGAIDENSNQRRDRREPYDSALVMLDSTASLVLWATPRDTAGPVLRAASRLDSLTIRLDFNQRLQPIEPDIGSVGVYLLPDTVPSAIAAVWRPAVWDSVQAIEQERAREAAADTVEADRGPEAADDPGEPVEQRPAPPARAAAPTPADTGRIARILGERPRLSDAWVVRLADPLVPGARYIIDARAPNVQGVTGQSRTLLILPEEPAERSP